MGQDRIIRKEDLNILLGELKKERKIIAPVKLAGEDVSFSYISSLDEICLNYINDLLPPKRFFFPQKDTLFSFKKNGEVELSSKLEEERRVIFGIRSCDVMGILYLEKFFKDNFSDSYFLKRKENTCLISLVCQEAGDNCFCLCANSGPALEKGFDLQLTDLGDKYLVDIGSDAGQEIINSFSHLFNSVSEEDRKRKEEIIEKVKYGGKFKEETGYLIGGIRKVTAGKVPDEVWQELKDGCLACGGCSYVCPTCSCFTVMDKEVDINLGKRERSWDSCVYAGFTREASGHNPRPTLAERRKHWFYHKLNYYTMKKSDDLPGCVCCGRCVTVCLGKGNDMSEVLKKIRESS